MKNTDLYSIFELSPTPMWVFDVQTLRFLDVNIAATVSYGYTKEEFQSMTINHIRPKDDVDWVKAVVKENKEKGNFFKNTFRHLTKSRQMIFVEIASNLIKFDGREARLVLATDITAQINAQQALILSEKRFKALVQDGSDMITIIDKDFRYTYVSPASLRVFGVQPELFMGKKAFAYIHPEDKKRVEAEAGKIWDKKSILLKPYRYRDREDNWLWIETRATNLFDEPSIAGIVCTSRDVTERIASEKLIHENIERYKIVSKATSDVIWDCNLKDETLVWNKAIKGILKHAKKEYTTLDWWKNQIHAEDRPRVVNKLNHHLKIRKIKWEDEYRFLGGDGIYRAIYDRGFVIFDENGSPTRMIGAMQDITSRKEKESWSKLLESVVINTTDGVLITDAAYPPIVVYVNDAMVSMSGYSKEELIGKLPDLLHGQQTDQAALSKLKHCTENLETCTVELVNMTKAGKPYHVSVNLSPVFAEDGKVVNWISIQRDVSEQRLHLDEIEAQNKLLNQISWMQSHVVRTPLARIMSLVSLLEDTPQAEPHQELFKYLKNAAAELDEVITAIANRTPYMGE